MNNVNISLPFPESDISELITDNEDNLNKISDGTVLLTGGTGFIGKWFLSLFSKWNDIQDRKIQVWIPSRNPDRFLLENPHLNKPEFFFFKADIRTLSLPEGPIKTVIHAATDVGNSKKASDFSTIFDVCVKGTSQLIEEIKGRGVERFLLLSSGAVYGRQDPTLERLCEDTPSSVDTTKAESAYGEGKRVSEWLVSQAGREQGFNVSIARIFALLGPGIPLDGPFASGNFFRDILNKDEIIIEGDGTVLRSYLYITDTITWLLTILTNIVKNKIYNIGSTKEISIKELAIEIAHLSSRRIMVKTLKTSDSTKLAERYIPDIQNIIKIKLQQKISLDEGLKRVYNWIVSN